MYIRHSKEQDLPAMMHIYEAARDFMARTGNPDQWGRNHWPPESLIRQDILSGHSYVCEENGRVVGTFFYVQGENVEPTYAHIEDGAWQGDAFYGVVHRIASDGTVKGVGSFCLDWAYAQCGHLRIDTHGDNRVMQNLLAKKGFIRCGIIHVKQDFDPRIAYEKQGPEP